MSQNSGGQCSPTLGDPFVSSRLSEGPSQSQVTPLGPAHSAWWFPCSFWAMHRTRGTPEPSALCPAPPHGRGEVGRGQQRFQVVPERARKKRHDSPGRSRQSGGGAAVSRGTGGPEAGRAFPEAALSPPGGPGACWSRLPGGRARVRRGRGASPHPWEHRARARETPRAGVPGHQKEASCFHPDIYHIEYAATVTTEVERRRHGSAARCDPLRAAGEGARLRQRAPRPSCRGR